MAGHAVEEYDYQGYTDKMQKYLGSNQSSEGFVTAIVSVLINTPTKII